MARSAVTRGKRLDAEVERSGRTTAFAGVAREQYLGGVAQWGDVEGKVRCLSAANCREVIRAKCPEGQRGRTAT